MTCPACQAVLRERRIAGIAIDECASCGGFWFDGDELDQYRARLTSRPRWSDGPFVTREHLNRMTCPRCRVLTLRDGSISGQSAFHCANCRGIFLSCTVVAELGRIRSTEHENVVDAVDLVNAVDLLDIVVEIAGSIFDL